MTWNIHDAELADTVKAERRRRAVNRRRCWIKNCTHRGDERITVPTARRTNETHWYCEQHATAAWQHVRVLTRILQIPAR